MESEPLGALPVLGAPGNGSGSSTAKTALEMLVAGDPQFRAPTASQRRNIAMAFAGDGRVVYGKAFDAVRLGEGTPVDLDDLDSVVHHLADITLYEVKSTNRDNVNKNFDGYFFAVSTAELLVAQSLGTQFAFVFIHTVTGERLELTLKELYEKLRAIYPSWSIRF